MRTSIESCLENYGRGKVEGLEDGDAGRRSREQVVCTALGNDCRQAARSGWTLTFPCCHLVSRTSSYLDLAKPSTPPLSSSIPGNTRCESLFLLPGQRVFQVERSKNGDDQCESEVVAKSTTTHDVTRSFTKPSFLTAGYRSYFSTAYTLF